MAHIPARHTVSQWQVNISTPQTIAGRICQNLYQSSAVNGWTYRAADKSKLSSMTANLDNKLIALGLDNEEMHARIRNNGIESDLEYLIGRQEGIHMTKQYQYDPLLECLAIFAKRYHRPISIESLVYGTPVKPGAPGPELFSIDNPKGLFSRVAKRAGFASRLTKRDIEDIPDLLLPCILVLHDRKACILESLDRENRQAKVIFPEIDEGEVWLELDKLEEQYIGYTFLLKRKYKTTHRHFDQLYKLREQHWFWGTLSKVKGIYGSVFLASIMINLFVLATPLFTMNVYDRVIPNNAVETLWVLAIGVAIVYVLDTVLRFIRNYLLDIASKKTDIIMSSILFSHVLNLKMDKWPASVGAFANRMGQFDSIRSFLTASTLLIIVDLPFAFLFLFVITYIGGPLVAVPLITMALLLLHGLLVVRPMRRSIEQVFSASAQKHSILVESLHAIKTFKTLGASQYAQWAWEESTGEISKHSLKSKELAGSISITTSLLVQLNTVGIVMLGFYEIMDLHLTLGGLIAVMVLSSRTISPMSQVPVLITNYQQTRTAYDSLDELMNMEVERPDDKIFVRRPDFLGKIEFKNAELKYPGSDTTAISGINLKINPGEHVGLIGRVGSGKSSIINLLLGLYSPTKGSVNFDDIDINQIDPADIRRNIAYLSQDVELIRGSIRENIVMKDPQAEDEDVLKAAFTAGVDLFVNKLPKGYDSPIGEQGHGISGGQRASLGLARALLLDEPILILDEPTSSIDNTTESIIRKRLFDYTRGRTLLLATHKQAMLALVERLVVFDDGKIIMDGPKEQVLKALQESGNVQQDG